MVGAPACATAIEGMAPFVVNVDAVATQLGAGDLLDARFDWDFGDVPDARYGQLPGWGGAHVYENPGQYTLRLSVVNSAGAYSNREISVSVRPNARIPVYVAASGNDAHDGATPGTAVRSVRRVQELLSDNRDVRFRRGDTFDFSRSQLVLQDLRNVVLGAYG